ncbi:hypothetical protein [Magnetococcus sp. PR-3]|uniref:hypothetical protein n=1 Tax=Magnetococcus sp. PR-3 TaxID=3120355 RepID=UPI002FCE4C76
MAAASKQVAIRKMHVTAPMMVWSATIMLLLLLGGLLFAPVGNPDLPPQTLWLKAQHSLLPGLYWQRRLQTARLRVDQARIALDAAKHHYRNAVRGKRQKIEQARRLAQQEQRDPARVHHAIVQASRERIRQLRKKLQSMRDQLRAQQQKLEHIHLLKLQELGVPGTTPVHEPVEPVSTQTE